MVQDPIAEKYLKTYAEPVASRVARLPETYDAAVVVPSYAEEVSTFDRLTSAAGSGAKNLLILVVNAPLDAPADYARRNDTFLEAVRESGVVTTLDAGVEWIARSQSVSKLDVLLLDATRGSLKLRAKEGVGRARKMGLDVALSLYLRGQLLSPMCGSTDADVSLPQGYFGALRSVEDDAPGTPLPRTSLPRASGIIFPYRHLLPKEGRVREMMTELEVSFRYYVLGLHHAGSPYAFHTLGSAVAVSLPHYARVRGVPNRQAGEDFHLLAKLSKLMPLKRLTEPTIEIETRVSDRVPFGTGPSLSKALGPQDGGVRFHHPLAFQWLREVLDALSRAADEGQDSELAFSGDLPEWARERAREVYRSALPHFAGCPTSTHRRRRLNERFDALATIQFIHEAHRNGLSRLAFEPAFELGAFLPSGLTREGALRYCVQAELSIDTPAGISPT